MVRLRNQSKPHLSGFKAVSGRDKRNKSAKNPDSIFCGCIRRKLVLSQNPGLVPEKPIFAFLRGLEK